MRAGDPVARDAIGCQAGDVEAAEPHAAAIGFLDAVDQIEHRGLARAVGPDQTENLPFAHGEAQVAHGAQPAKALAEIRELEQRAHARTRRRRGKRW
jgi:hypothetical protein